MTASDRSVPLPAPRSPLPLEVQCTHRAPLRAESRRRMRLVLGIAAAVMVAEAVGGYAAGSLALLADAGHMLTDVAALGLALVVAHLCERPVTAERSYGLQRLEILAALVNGAALLVIPGGVSIEGGPRVPPPPAARPGRLPGAASLGLVANVVSARILHSDHDH